MRSTKWNVKISHCRILISEPTGSKFLNVAGLPLPQGWPLGWGMASACSGLTHVGARPLPQGWPLGWAVCRCPRAYALGWGMPSACGGLTALRGLPLPQGWPLGWAACRCPRAGRWVGECRPFGAFSCIIGIHSNTPTLQHSNISLDWCRKPGSESTSGTLACPPKLREAKRRWSPTRCKRSEFLITPYSPLPPRFPFPRSVRTLHPHETLFPSALTTGAP